jgi:hypothetical protein
VIRLIAIDPGAHTGWAVFYDAELVSCGLCELTKGERPPKGPYDLLYWEHPTVYPGCPAGKARDILTLLDRARDIADYVQAVRKVSVLPRDWKGTIPKTTQNRRDVNRLNQTESTVLFAARAGNGRPVAQSLLNNVIDAVGLGLWAVGRGNHNYPTNAITKPGSYK